jgi:hypothetical protein
MHIIFALIEIVYKMDRLLFRKANKKGGFETNTNVPAANPLIEKIKYPEHYGRGMTTHVGI